MEEKRITIKRKLKESEIISLNGKNVRQTFPQTFIHAHVHHVKSN